MIIVSIPNDDRDDSVRTEGSDLASTSFLVDPADFQGEMTSSFVVTTTTTTTTSSPGSVEGSDAVMYMDEMPAVAQYTYESDPEILKAQLDLMSSPYSNAYSDEAYAAILNVQQQCQADYVASCTDAGGFVFALNEFFNDFGARRALAEGPERMHAERGGRSFFKDRLVDPARHVFNALTGRRTPHMQGEKPRDRQQAGPSDAPMRGRPAPQGEARGPPKVRGPAMDGAADPMFTLRGGMANVHHGAHLGPPPMAPQQWGGAGDWAAKNQWDTRDKSASSTSASSASADAAPLPALIPAAPDTPTGIAPAVQGAVGISSPARKLWHHEDNSHNSGNGRDHNRNHHDGSDSSSSSWSFQDVKPISEPSVIGPAPAADSSSSGVADGDVGFFNLFNGDNSGDSSSSSSSESGQHWHGHHHDRHDHHARPQVSSYSGSLGFGTDGDSCVYANLDTFSQQCQDAVREVYTLRSDYEEVSSGRHGCHGHGFFIFLIIFAAVFVLSRKHRARKQKIAALLQALDANPALKATVERETGVVVPPPCIGAGKCRVVRAVTMFLLVVVSGFMLVMTSLVISGNLIMMLTSVDDNGNYVYPDPGTIILLVAVVIFTNLLIMFSVATLTAGIVKKLRARRQARAAGAASSSAPAVPSSPVSPRPCRGGRCFFTRVMNLVPSYPVWRNVNGSSPERGLYAPLNSSDEQQSEMVNIEYGNRSSVAPPQYVLPQQVISSHYSPPATPVYVPVTVSAESMSNINML